MFSFKGSNATLAFSAKFNEPKIIENFSIVPKSGSSVVNVYLLTTLNGFVYNICLMPNNYNISANSDYEQQRQIVMLSQEQIKVQASSPVDYDFNISDMIIPDPQ